MEQFYNKHYIRLNENNYIIHGFSDAFEQPLDTDICINEQGGRHFELSGYVNCRLTDRNRHHLYKYIDNTIIPTTEEDRAAELSSIMVAPLESEKMKLEMKALQEQNKMLTECILEISATIYG